MSDAVLIAENVQKTYGSGASRLDVLRGVSLTLRGGETTALVGPSGSGKSTLLHILGLLDHPDGGRIVIAGEDISRANDMKRTALRRRTIGFVYQFHHLLPEFSALENVNMPQMLAGKSENEASVRSKHLLDLVGLTARLTHRPAELSGGEQQRVAIARALANAPKLLIADEPTGNLDHMNSGRIFAVLQEACARESAALLMATHNPELSRQLHRTVTMQDGLLV
jgi:lipoprotein-releasing system ATP-binding protein